MTEKLNDFVALLAEAKKQQKDSQAQKVAEAAPFLGDLFSTVAESKKVVQVKKEEEKKKAEPILKEFQEALQNPEKFKNSSDANKKKVIEIVEQLESKAEELEAKLKNSKLQKQINSVEKEQLTELEKKFLTMFKTLQTDFNTLKQYVNAIPRTNPAAWGGGGSGEVNLRYLDDVDITTLSDGLYLRFNSTKNKFEFANPETGGGAGNGTETRTFRGTINTTPGVPSVITHNLSLPFKESLVINTFLDGEKVDVKVQTLTINSLQITTEIATTGLFVSIIGII